MPPRPRQPHQLPPGRHGLTPSYVARHQRRRLLDGIVSAVATHGYAPTTIEHIASDAGVSRRTFYDWFPNKEAAFITAYDDIVERLLHTMRTAPAAEEPDWVRRIHAHAHAFLEFLALAPAVAHVYVVDVLAAGPPVLERRTAALYGFRELVLPAGDHPNGGFVPPRAGEAAIGAAHELIFEHLRGGPADRLPVLLPDVVHVLVLPFAGQEAAEAAYKAAFRGDGPASGTPPHAPR